MEAVLLCWRCGESLEKLTLPIGRQDECPACTNHVHVCRMCVYYDPLVAKACREDDAEEVKEKERANFCDYFQPSERAFDGREAAAETRAKQGLDALFGASTSADGDPAGDDDNSLSDADALFGKDD